MKIESVELKRVSIPLKKPFKTALRRVDTAENIIVVMTADDGTRGYGEAPPTAAITGDTNETITSAIKEFIAPAITGLDIENLDEVMYRLQHSVEGNTSPKAACDMAVYDLWSKHYGQPLYKLLGGYRKDLETDLTISINEPEEMRRDALAAIGQGFHALKLKVGIDSDLDIERVRTIREAAGPDIKLRLDANQGWTPEEAIRTIRRFEDLGLDIEFVEQPVKARDFAGLKKVHDNVSTRIMADESMFSPADAIELLHMEAVDLINIKLMKCAGIHNALKIAGIAETYGVECMLGCMIESKVSLTAAAHLAAAKKNITRVDLDAAILLAEDPVQGGFKKEIPHFFVTDAPGLGITGIEGLMEL
ncbi:dipeptide epimerase [Emergencia sp.]|uniref:dipeptide epimerase n=1 Tax=Emergencia sp. TaxID=1926557 RepID=UPI003AF0C773